MYTSHLAYDANGDQVLIGSRTADGVRKPATICTFAGGELQPFDPDVRAIRIADIAHALGMICRYTGHVREFWSVAAHSVEISHRIEAKGYARHAGDRLSELVILQAALSGLMHDATETYLVDVPRPLKPFFPGYVEREATLATAINYAFDELPAVEPPIVKQEDTAILVDEIANFFNPGSKMWQYYGITKREDYPRLLSLSPEQGPIVFQARFDNLVRRIREIQQ